MKVEPSALSTVSQDDETLNAQGVYVKIRVVAIGGKLPDKFWHRTPKSSAIVFTTFNHPWRGYSCGEYKAATSSLKIYGCKAPALAIDALQPKKADHLQCPNPKARIGFLVRYISSKFGILNSTRCPGRMFNEDVREMNLNKRNSKSLNLFLVQSVIFVQSHLRTCGLDWSSISHTFIRGTMMMQACTKLEILVKTWDLITWLPQIPVTNSSFPPAALLESVQSITAKQLY